MANTYDMYNGSAGSVTPTGGSAIGARSKSAAAAAATDASIGTSFLATGGCVALKPSSTNAEKMGAALQIIADVVNNLAQATAQPNYFMDVSTKSKIKTLFNQASKDDENKIIQALKLASTL